MEDDAPLSDLSLLTNSWANGRPTGWLDMPERHVIAAHLPRFQQAWMLAAEPSTPIRLYRAWYDVLGSYPSYVEQTIGDCVSHGFGRGLDNLQAVEIALGEESTYAEACTEFIYGASRKAANILGPQDGSFGSAAAEALISGGAVKRTAPYDGKTAKKWGMTGPPANLEAEAMGFRLGGVALIKDWQGLVSALWNGMPVPICSDQGFTMTRDAQGFCRPEGTWHHCMMINAVRFDRPGACINQSWGPATPGGPMALDQPTCSFWADKKVIEKILGQGDSWALMRAPEFVPSAHQWT